MANHKNRPMDSEEQKRQARERETSKPSPRADDSQTAGGIVEGRFSPVLRNILDVYKLEKRIPVPSERRR